MKMGKEFYKAIDDANKTNSKALKKIIAGYIEDLAADYPNGGYKYRCAMKAVNKIREDAN